MIKILIHFGPYPSCPHFHHFVMSKNWPKSNKIIKFTLLKKHSKFSQFFVEECDKCFWKTKSLHQLFFFYKTLFSINFVYLFLKFWFKSQNPNDWMIPTIIIKYSITIRARVNHLKYTGYVATLLWPSVGVKPNTWKKFRVFRVR